MVVFAVKMYLIRINSISYMLWLSQVFENVHIADTLEILKVLCGPAYIVSIYCKIVF